MSERAKFEEENNGDAMIRSGSSSGSTMPTKAVVSIVVALRGRSDALQLSGVRGVNDVRSVLQSLAAEALTDEGENVMAVEVLWTPSERNTVVSDRDIITDYPELMRL